jgi:hypothetical protein
MSYNRKILREFIRAEIARARRIDEKLTSGETLGIDGETAAQSKRIPTYKERWGFERASATDSPWLNMLGFASPVEDLWNNFFGQGGWFTPELGGFTALGEYVVNGFTSETPGHRGGQWQQRMSSAFPRTSGILSGPGTGVTSFGAPTSQSIFADQDMSARAGYPVTRLGVPIRESADVGLEDRNQDIAWTHFSAAINQDLHALVNASQDIRNSGDAITGLEKFNRLFGRNPNLTDLRTEFNRATDEDLDKDGLHNAFSREAAPQFISHAIDVGIEDILSNLTLDPRQTGEIQNLVANAKMRL